MAKKVYKREKQPEPQVVEGPQVVEEPRFYIAYDERALFEASKARVVMDVGVKNTLGEALEACRKVLRYRFVLYSHTKDDEGNIVDFRPEKFIDPEAEGWETLPLPD